MTRNGQIYILLILVIVIGLMFGTYDRAVDITFESPFVLAKSIDSKKPVKYFGVVSRYTPREIYEGYQPIMDFLTEKTPYRFVLKLSDTYTGTAKQLGDGTVAVASLGSFVYVKYKEQYDLEVILKPLNQQGKGFYHSMFISLESSSISSLSDLNNRSLVFPSQESLTGQWMPSYLFSEARVSLSNLSKYDYVSHHTTVADKVLSGEYDAGVVKEAVAELYKEYGLKVFHIAPKRTTIPLVVSKHTDQKTRQSIMDALLSLDIQQKETWDLLELWDKELSYGFEKANDNDYELIRDIINQVDR
ncbi:MAG: PhnD/SsuA/transferrin family substrate-binding protein [Candidatus Marinimicrobia bacterium]|nr:PhnD/SsuA/transferrin family substrate-binding protein [Candidatus Neomarinimicrobiota bacterium]MBL7031526.1 PhnD/SsuA/transferrin family substrate-binding protein [Candidatus Neomarinimicrobiota bacterium]